MVVGCDIVGFDDGLGEFFEEIVVYVLWEYVEVYVEEMCFVGVDVLVKVGV